MRKKIIGILLTLIILCLGALISRIIYLCYWDDGSNARVSVPDNWLGKETPPSSTPSMPNTELSTPSLSSKQGNPLLQPEATVIRLYNSQMTENRAFQVENMFPGDCISQYFAVTINHHADVTVYFTAPVTAQTKELADVLQIRVTQLNHNTVLYDGAFAQLDSNGYGETFAATGSTETVAYYQIQVSLPTRAGNDYQTAKLTADFRWSVQTPDALEPPQTGDDRNPEIWIAVFGCALLVMVVMLLRKRREREGADDGDRSEKRNR